ncbi:GNAT family N-acetyltransferase [Amycolatopsis sp. cg5]|uniref:GNAT family N-acetyltransferase n=1 Tax=Amycolatopsis sp. cg5 TaxID=3238802 RepID=UPI00352617B3
MDVKVEKSSERSRYEVLADGVLAGFAEYERQGAELAFTHTEIKEEFGGQGLASKLIRAALDDARTQGVGVLPYCPFVCGFVKKNAEYVDLVPEGRRAEFEL